MDRILDVFCGENVSCLEEWAKKREVPQELLSHIYESLIDSRNAYQHIEDVFNLFEKEEDESIRKKIRMALVRVQLFSQYHMFERMLFGYNLMEGKKPKKEESSEE